MDIIGAIRTSAQARALNVATSGSPTEIVRMINAKSTDYFTREYERLGLQTLVKLMNPLRNQRIPSDFVENNSPMVIALAAGRAFLTLDVGAIIVYGSAAVIGATTVLVVGAGAAGYGAGTVIDRSFNLSDRLGDGLYNFTTKIRKLLVPRKP